MASLIRCVLVRCWQCASGSINQGEQQGRGDSSSQQVTADKVSSLAQQALGCFSIGSQIGCQHSGSGSSPVPSSIPVCRFGSGEEFILTPPD